jgi:hypothetical protein
VGWDGGPVSGRVCVRVGVGCGVRWCNGWKVIGGWGELSAQADQANQAKRIRFGYLKRLNVWILMLISVCRMFESARRRFNLGP